MDKAKEPLLNNSNRNLNKIETSKLAVPQSILQNLPIRRPSKQCARRFSIEDAHISEIITIYRKMKKGDGKKVFYRNDLDVASQLLNLDSSSFEETISFSPNLNIPVFNESKTTTTIPKSQSLIDFAKYMNVSPSKYLYFSHTTGLLQADVLKNLVPSSNIKEVLATKNYWLNIFDPSEEDFQILFQAFGIHDLTINDIREGYTEEKMEAFGHYTFFSLRLLYENLKQEDDQRKDTDFNILLFKDFVITLHDQQWSSINDMLGFLNLLITQGGEPVLNPDWVLFSCFIEMNQDAQYILDLIEPEIRRIQNCAISSENISLLLRKSYSMRCQVQSIIGFIKPKSRILRKLKAHYPKRVNNLILEFLDDIAEDLREMEQDLRFDNHLLEKSQDNLLGVIALEQSRQANLTSETMRRLGILALIFLPIQLISGLFGMNVTVPFQTDNYPSQAWFWLIVGVCFMIIITIFSMRKRIMN